MLKFLLAHPIHGVSTSLGLLIFRVFIGSSMLSHGLPKLMKFSERLNSFSDPLGIGSGLSLTGTVLSEVVFASALIAGAFTRISAIPFSFTMLVAGLIVHADDPFGGKEKALLFAFAGILLFFTGAGKYSVDSLRK